MLYNSNRETVSDNFAFCILHFAFEIICRVILFLSVLGFESHFLGENTLAQTK